MLLLDSCCCHLLLLVANIVVLGCGCCYLCVVGVVCWLQLLDVVGLLFALSLLVLFCCSLLCGVVDVRCCCCVVVGVVWLLVWLLVRLLSSLLFAVLANVIETCNCSNCVLFYVWC